MKDVRARGFIYAGDVGSSLVKERALRLFVKMPENKCNNTPINHCQCLHKHTLFSFILLVTLIVSFFFMPPCLIIISINFPHLFV